MEFDEIEKFAKIHGYQTAKIGGISKWHGFDVYEPIYDLDKEKVCIGLPYVILVKGNDIRMSNVKESFAYLDDFIGTSNNE